MTDDYVENFAQFMTGIGEYYGKSVSEALLDLYLEDLGHYAIDDLKKAARLHRANPEGGQFFPKTADFARHILGVSSDRALQAWSKVDKAVRTVGPYKTVVFDDSIIHAVIEEMGGWIGFGNFSSEEWHFKQNEFVKRYRGYLNSGNVGHYAGKLTGVCDMQNHECGYVTDSNTVLLGNHDKAMDVLRLGSEAGKDKPLLLSDYAKKPSLRLIEKI